MGGNYVRLKTWVANEDVVYSDLNAEFDNILTNFTPQMMDDYSTNVTQMQITTDPGEVGTESVATTLAGELARLRFIISEITGENEWYESPVSSLTGLANAVGTGLTANRIVSGRVRTGSQFPIHLVPNGAARTVKLDGTPTNFIYYVNGIEYNIDADVTVTNLTLAPSSNNTCLIDDANASAQFWTKTTGENGTSIPVDTMGSEITALTGKLAAFKIVNGSAATEYFIAEVASSTSLIRAKRGFFFDSTDAPVPRVVYSNNNTITLMKLTWIFATTSETLTATYNPPTWSKDEPSSPSIGDYWFDTDNNTWKKYDVSSFIAADATLVGCCIQDGTATIGARSFEAFANFDDAGAVELVYSAAAVAVSNNRNAYINVWGTTIKNERGLFSWDMTAHLDSGVTEASSTYYYFYITEEGDRIISDIRPYDCREDLRGWYHPHQSWRCVGSAFNDGSSNLSAVESFWNRYESKLILPSQTTAQNVEVVSQITPISSSGGAVTFTLPPAANWRGQVLSFVKTSSDHNVITLDGFAAETINGATTTTLDTQYESVDLLSDGTEIFIKFRTIPSAWVNAGVNTISATTSAPTKASAQVLDKLFWRRSGPDMEIRMEYEQDNGTSGATGTGDYLFTIPTTRIIDVALVDVYTTVSNIDIKNTVGNCGGSSSTNVSLGAVVVYSTTQVRYYGVDGPAATCVAISATKFPLNAAANYYASYKVPISGWKG